ncbi:hypothetical protein NGB36_14380 [Streptomyces sp. RB6PN25]|uniref:Uncharacterized protein n=1 Tax=Streptomyces humicola TaxID=2953240 RepID=A0ABT1PVR5_9ACTN|nr:hypothetical protein [Streptomyces humicola]MCQ4081761.1 hypothetical protein [Streptomyces humicola]
MLDALVQTSSADTKAELRQGARFFERATRSHIRTEQAELRALRRAAREIVSGGPALGRGGDALAASLDEAVRAGHNPAALLKQTGEIRELGTANHISDVLVWRLRRLGNLPASVDLPKPPPNRRLAPTTPATAATTRTVPPPTPGTARPRAR